VKDRELVKAREQVKRYKQVVDALKQERAAWLEKE
jgi:hypothetical protein